MINMSKMKIAMMKKRKINFLKKNKKMKNFRLTILKINTKTIFKKMKTIKITKTKKIYISFKNKKIKKLTEKKKFKTNLLNNAKYKTLNNYTKYFFVLYS